jgi:hypothetical protein
MIIHDLQLLVFELALKLLGLGDLADGLVEVVLVYGVAVIFDGKETTRNQLLACLLRVSRDEKRLTLR